MTAAPAGGRGGRGRRRPEGTVARDQATPEHLAPLELERELLAGAFRAAAILEEAPDHAAALAAVEYVRRLDARDLCYAEHRDVLGAVQWTLREDATISPGLVRDELRRRRQWGAVRLLPELVDYGTAPVASIATHVRKVREAAQRRRELEEHRGAAAEILGGTS